MTLTKWQFALEDGLHILEVERWGWNARHTVRLDGQEVFAGNVPIEFGQHIPLELPGHRGLLEINVPEGLAYEYQLKVDGQAIPIHSGPQRTQQPQG